MTKSPARTSSSAVEAASSGGVMDSDVGAAVAAAQSTNVKFITLFGLLVLVLGGALIYVIFHMGKMDKRIREIAQQSSHQLEDDQVESIAESVFTSKAKNISDGVSALGTKQDEMFGVIQKQISEIRHVIVLQKKEMEQVAASAAAAAVRPFYEHNASEEEDVQEEQEEDDAAAQEQQQQQDDDAVEEEEEEETVQEEEEEEQVTSPKRSSRRRVAK